MRKTAVATGNRNTLTGKLWPGSLALSVESRGTWRSWSQELRDIHGYADVDLAVTPPTNTLPIRRLNLQVGSSESFIATWVKFPELTIQTLSQRYTRLGRNIYRYESNTGFSAEIVVDDLVRWRIRV